MRILGTTIKASTLWTLLFLTIAAYHLVATLIFLRVAVPAVARVQGFRSQSVTANIESRYGSRRTTYFTNIPIIKFRTAAGNEYELSKLTPFGLYEEGQAIDVLYDPKKPGNSRQNTLGAIWGTCILFLFVTLVILLYRLTFFMKKHRVQQRRREGR